MTITEQIQAGARVSVPWAQSTGTPQRANATVVSVGKKMATVVVDGRDVTSRVQVKHLGRPV